MKDNEFRAFLDLLMCSDPWPVTGDEGVGQSVLTMLADKEAKNRGFENWVVAYHSMPN